MKKLIVAQLIVFYVSLSFDLFGQREPQVNPITEANHWSNAIAWNNVTNVTKVKGLLGRENAVDSVVFHQTMETISKNGGGVLFFPVGTYIFKNTIMLYDGVVLRGENPLGVKNAKHQSYSLPTIFEFPRYKPKMDRMRADTSLFKNVSNQTAFKSIKTNTRGIKNFGLVNIDINRAIIDFRKKNTESMGFRNVLIYGIKQNNAVVPVEGIPTAAQIKGGNNWQRWTEKYIGNINLSVEANALVANCKLNDNTKDSFKQFGYMVDDGFTFDGSRAVFDYINHIGIMIEEVKTTPSTGSVINPTETDNLIASNSKNMYTNGSIEVLNNYMKLTEGNEFVKSDCEKCNVFDNDFQTTKQQYASSIIDGLTPTNTAYRTPYDKPDEVSTAYIHTYRKGESLPYRLIKPLNYDPSKKYPIVLYLHGLGERGNDNRESLRNFIWYFNTPKVRADYPCFILIPQHAYKDSTFLGNERKEHTRTMKAVLDVMKKVEKENSIDGSRRYIVGISSGGWATWETIIKFPKTFAAAVPISAYKRFNEWNEKDRLKEINTIKNFPIWAFHGSDDEWIPAMYARLTVSTLKSGGGVPKYTEFKGVGHICWDEIQYVEEFLPWLFSQKRN